MGKILKFPTPEEQKNKQRQEQVDQQLKESKEAVDGRINECVYLTQTMLQYIEDSILSGDLSDWDVFMGMDFRDERYAESRDMFVIINLFNAMLNRFVSVPHDLQKDLDKEYLRIKAWSHEKDKDSYELDFEPGFEIYFEPDFEMDISTDPEEDDDNN
jgi:hypothetical protein